MHSPVGQRHFVACRLKSAPANAHVPCSQVGARWSPRLKREFLRREHSSGLLASALENPVLAMLEDGEAWDPQQTHDYVDGLRKMHRALKGA